MKECPNCKKELAENAKFCTKCGTKLEETVKTEKPVVQEEITEMKEENRSEEVSNVEPIETIKKVKKKNPKIKETRNILNRILATICILAISITVGIVVWKNNSLDGIEVDGNFYTFSAQNGIDNYEDINDGIVSERVYGFGAYQARGTSKTEKVSLSDYSTWIGRISSSDYYDIGCGTFVFSDNFKTQEGITQNSTQEELEKKGYMKYSWGGYGQFATNQGPLDWSLIEEDYDKSMEEESFRHLEYYNAILCVGGWSDFAEAKSFEPYFIKELLAEAKLAYALEQGEIEYYYEKEIDVVNNSNILRIDIYAHEDSVENWMNIWTTVDE